MKKIKKVSIIGTVGVPACYGGFESLVENLLDYTPSDVEYTVFCSGKRYTEKKEEYKKAKLIYLSLEANGKWSLVYDFICMIKSLHSDVMLLLGNSGSWALPFIRKIYKGKIIINIDGLEFQRDKFSAKTKRAIHFLVDQSVKYSDVIIGDNRGITDFIMANYHKSSELIAYGGNQAKRIKKDELYEVYPFCKAKYAISVCRIEPENNIHIILEAFSKTVSVPLVLVGNWENSAYGKSLKEMYSSYSHIHLLSPIYELETINWLRGNAAIYLHGHSVGGTNPSLVEAMNLGLPILAFDCIYNKATTNDKALYWKTSDDIVQLLGTSTEKLAEIAETMLFEAKEKYTWQVIAEKYNKLY